MCRTFKAGSGGPVCTARLAEQPCVLLVVRRVCVCVCVQAGIDLQLARHVAHLFTRDPLVIRKDRLHLNDDADTDHWENIQSTVRAAPELAPLASPPRTPCTPDLITLAWLAPRRTGKRRVRPRALEQAPAPQLRQDKRCASMHLPTPCPCDCAPTGALEATSQGSAVRATCGLARRVPLDGGANDRLRERGLHGVRAFVPLSHCVTPLSITVCHVLLLQVFIVLLSRVILAFDLNLYMPLSLVDENMRRAHTRNATTAERFHFRALEGPNEGSIMELSLAEILGGKEGAFPGFVPLIFAYLDEIECDPETLVLVSNYMELILRRARGELLTPAAWMRDFIQHHEDYAGDSIVPESTAHDLLQACAAIGEGRRQEPTLVGKHPLLPLRTDNAWPTPLIAPRLSRDALSRYHLTKAYRDRDAPHKQDFWQGHNTGKTD